MKEIEPFVEISESSMIYGSVCEVQSCCIVGIGGKNRRFRNLKRIPFFLTSTPVF